MCYRRWPRTGLSQHVMAVGHMAGLHRRLPLERDARRGHAGMLASIEVALWIYPKDQFYSALPQSLGSWKALASALVPPLGRGGDFTVEFWMRCQDLAKRQPLFTSSLPCADGGFPCAEV